VTFKDFVATVFAVAEMLRSQERQRLEREIQADLEYGRD
jgi:hypothetical protein